MKCYVQTTEMLKHILYIEIWQYKMFNKTIL